jgi:hypothetical protein
MNKLTGKALWAALLRSPGSILRQTRRFVARRSHNVALVLVAFAGSLTIVGLAVDQSPTVATAIPQAPVAHKSSDVQHDLSAPLRELVGKVQTAPLAPPNRSVLR